MAPRTRPPAHYISHNKTTRVPRHYVVLDSEAHRAPRKRGEIQTFRLAVAQWETRAKSGDGWREPTRETFDTPLALWETITFRAAPRARTVLVAHNIGYDLRICDAFTVLPALGWRLDQIRMRRGSAFCRWRQGDRTLVCADTFGWLPTSLDAIGTMLGISKLKLPGEDDSYADWRSRCERDVAILARALRALVEWVRRDDLGNFKPSGAGQAWAAYRHRFLSHKVLAHDDDQARAAERDAAFTGRCEVWQHGKPSGGPFTEFDYSTAYARVGSECDLPYQLVGRCVSPSGVRLARLGERFAVLTEVDISTDVPTVPARIEGHICWPVGTFRTTLWENELALAVEHGARVTPVRAWWYRRAPILSEFMGWCLDSMRPTNEPDAQLIAFAVKHWSRAIVGRFGARYSEWETCGRAPVNDCSISTVIDGDTGERYQMMHVGTELKRASDIHDAQDSVVAVMSWIMAECRVRLWRLIEHAGAENVVYMDTDGLIANAAGTERLRNARVDGLREKGSWRDLEVIGVRRLLLSGTLRAAGVPKGATRIGARVWEADVWTGLESSLRAREADKVAIARRRVNITGKDARRIHLADGMTQAVTVANNCSEG